MMLRARERDTKRRRAAERDGGRRRRDGFCHTLYGAAASACARARAWSRPSNAAPGTGRAPTPCLCPPVAR
eukprot:7351282-Prymnesium_polylepis.2